MNIEQTLGWAYSYACNLADIGLDIRNIEVPAILTQAENDRIIDNRPLTEETLQELGFEDGELNINNFRLVKRNDYNDVPYIVQIENFKPKYKTVGSVRMLIEALKGDE